MLRPAGTPTRSRPHLRSRNAVRSAVVDREQPAQAAAAAVGGVAGGAGREGGGGEGGRRRLMSSRSLPGLRRHSWFRTISWNERSPSAAAAVASSSSFGHEMSSHFDIPHKEATTEALQKWRKSSLVLNASRRFRYVENLKTRTERRQRKQLKVVGVATQAALRFINAGLSSPSTADAALEEAREKALEKAISCGFQVDAITLSSMVENGDHASLKQHDGVGGLARELRVDVKDGLRTDAAEMELRQEVYGTNTYPEKPPKGFFVFVKEAMSDLTLMVLSFCAVLSLGVGIATEGLREGWYDGVGIGLSILLVVFVTAASDYQQSLQFRDLEEEKKKIFIQVSRGGRRDKVSIYDLLVGDIVHLSIGDQVPGDGVLIEGYELSIDESSMTGESHLARKNSQQQPFLLSGTKVQDGSGIMLVTAVGMNTEWGHLMATLGKDDHSETPLQVKLNGLATFIGTIGLGFAVLTFLVLLGRFIYGKVSTGESFDLGDDTLKIVDFFAIAVTIIVVAVPEGLPLAVTLTLAYAMKKMIHDKALVRKLAACETMGSATAICSDKTGTLTTNQMTVVKAWVAGAVRNVSQIRTELSPVVRDILVEHVYRNTSGDVGEVGMDGKPVLIGTPTECAILGLGVAVGGDFKEVCDKYKLVKVNPFNSARKRMGVAVRHPDGHLRAHWKGASEVVLGMCDRTVDSEGKVVPLDQKKYNQLMATIRRFADEALRTLCLAYSEVDGEIEEIPEKHCVCLAIVGIKDPVRPGVPEAVKLCEKAGIKVRMVTGDNINTAKAIARECGILTDGVAVEGPHFRSWSDAEMKEKIPTVQVMARSSPTDKYTLVTQLRELGEVVAVTGDGTNDAPALHEADIGMAMGIAGTEVAKESADVIVLDDNFGTIVVVAKWGRAVYTNIQKFVQFQLTVNLVALVINFTSACFTGEAPLTAVQLLWVNLIMDTLGALALATEPPHDDLLNKKSIGRKGNFISSVMWRNILGQVLYQLIVLGILQYKGQDLLHLNGTEEDIELLNTLIFNAFVFCQVFNEINSREMEKLNVFAHTFDNWVFLLVVTFTVVFQWILVTFLGKLASTVPLSGDQWLLTVSIGAFSMVVAVIVKLIPVPTEKRLPQPLNVLSNGYEEVTETARDTTV